MREQVPLLEFLVKMWDPDKQVFKVGVHDLTIEIEDIYFLMGLSRRGHQVSLTGFRAGGAKTEHLVRYHCVAGTMKISGKIPIRDVRDLPLQTILFTIVRIVGSQTPHLATNTYMQYSIDCMAPTVFNWCAGLLENMKYQLTK
jgi:hypothetical protein